MSYINKSSFYMSDDIHVTKAFISLLLTLNARLRGSVTKVSWPLSGPLTKQV